MASKTKLVMVRLSEDEHGMFSRRARSEQRKLSDWLRVVGVQACGVPVSGTWTRPSHDLKVTGFGQPDRIITVAEQQQAIAGVRGRKTAAEIAASIPGVGLGVLNDAEVLDLGNAPMEDAEIPIIEKRFDWAAKFAKWRAAGDDADMENEMRELGLPGAFWSLRAPTPQKLAALRQAWLEENRIDG